MVSVSCRKRPLREFFEGMVIVILDFSISSTGEA